MKKIKKSVNYLIKVMMVFGLLFTDLSGFSYVFAMEKANEKVDVTDTSKINITSDKKVEDTKDKVVNNDFSASLTEDGKIIIKCINQEILKGNTKFTKALKETYKPIVGDEVSQVSQDTTEYNVDSLMSETGFSLDLSLSLYFDIKYDGDYNLSVVITLLETNKQITIPVLSEKKTFENGFSFIVRDAVTGDVIETTENIYNVTNSVLFSYKVLSGKLDPTKNYKLDGNLYSADELLGVNTVNDVHFYNKIHGVYSNKVALYDEEDNLIMERTANFKYGEYSDNANKLNDSAIALEMGDKYQFVSNSKDGILYVRLYNDKEYTINDLKRILDSTYSNISVKYVISNSEYSDLLGSASQMDEQTATDFLNKTKVDNDTVVVLTSDDLSVNFKCVLLGDMNEDLVLDSSDIDMMTDQLIDKLAVDSTLGDVNLDGKYNNLDLMHLNYIIKNNTWKLEYQNDLENTIKSSLYLENEKIVTGDEFTVDYIVSVSNDEVNGIAGNLLYDVDKLELLSVEIKKVNKNWMGTNNKGKFIFYGNEKLISEIEKDVTNVDGAVPNIKEKDYQDYQILTFTFKALKQGKVKLQLFNPEFFADINSYNVTDFPEVIKEIEVMASNDNSLASLEVAGNIINLSDETNYTVNVENDVLLANIKYELNNIGASVEVLDLPEELAVGSNLVKIVVTAENGEEKIYTIDIIRKEELKIDEDAPVDTSYDESNYDDSYYQPVVDNSEELNEDKKDDEIEETDKEEDKKEELDEDEEESKVSRIIIIILILLVIAGLIYLIFKDEKDDSETRKVNKDINKMKNNNDFVDVKVKEIKEKKPEKKSENKSEKKPEKKKETNSKTETKPKKENHKNVKKER